MPASTSNSLDGILGTVIRKHFDLANPSVITPRLQYRNVYTFMTSNTATEEIQPLGAVSPDDWDTYAKTGAKAEGGIREGYLKTFTHVEHVIRMRIKKKLIRQAKIDVVNQHIAQYRLSLERKREADGMSIFTNAFATAGPDGVSLCNASHPISPHDSSTVQSNTATTALSYSAVKTARTAIRNFADDRNQPLYMDGNAIIVPNNISQETEEIVNALAIPGSAENDANAAAGLRVFRFPALTDTNNWFLVDAEFMRQNCLWFDSNMVDPMIVDEDTTDVVWELNFEWSYGFVDWRWIYGHDVT